MLRAESVVISHDLVGWEFLGGATVVQTWHGNALKTIGKDAGSDSALIREWLQTHLLQDWDYITVTGGGTPKRTFGSAFQYSEDQIVETGYPRNDPLYREIDYSGLDGIGKHESWRDHINENKCILYMPTWRRGIYGSEGKAIEDHGLELESVGEFCEQRGFEFLLKLHPSEEGETDDYDAVHTLPEYLDIYDVLSDVDILVTDYSSIYFDYLHVNKPIVFYPYDLDTYESMRGFYFDYDEVTPGPSAFSQSELLRSLDEFMCGNDQYEPQRRQLLNEFYDHTDGKSSKRIMRILE